jgi:threonine/homoserine/homoserine lactone efflux protein
VNDIILTLTPVIIGSAVVPVQIIVIILLLKSPSQGLLKALAFLVGMTSIRLLQGVVFGQVLTGGADASVDQASEKGFIASTLLLVLGILLLISAYKKWEKEPDPDAPPARYLTFIDSASWLQAFVIGFAFPLISPKLWVFMLTAISEISAAQLGQPASTAAFLIFLLLAQSLMLLPILIRILLPRRSVSMLESISAWLTRNDRVIVIAVSLVFGLLFFYKGVSGLLG